MSFGGENAGEEVLDLHTREVELVDDPTKDLGTHCVHRVGLVQGCEWGDVVAFKRRRQDFTCIREGIEGSHSRREDFFEEEVSLTSDGP